MSSSMMSGNLAQVSQALHASCKGQIFTVSDLYDLLPFLNHHKRTLQLHNKPNWVVKHEIKLNGINNI